MFKKEDLNNPHLNYVFDELRQEKIGEDILKPRIELLIKEVMNKPDLLVRVLTVFLNRRIQWNVIQKFEQQGKPVKCSICHTSGFNHYWCKPCFNPALCCECCILLGIPENIVPFEGK